MGNELKIFSQCGPNPDWAKLPLFDRKGWKRLPFGAFADSIGERVEPSDAADDIYVGLDDLDSGCLHIRRWGKGSDVIGTKLRFRKGDIIFGRRRAYQRKLAVAEFDGICSAHAMVVRAKPELVLPEFLPFLMMSDRFMNRAVEISVGSLSPTINWKTIKLEEFSLPPLDQQRNMAEIYWAVDENVENWRMTKIQLEQAQIARLGAIMLGMTSDIECHLRDIGDFLPPIGWQVKRAEEIVSGPITKGTTPTRQMNTEKANVPFLKVYNLTFTGDLDFTIDPTYVEPEVHQMELKRSKVRAGDILMNIVGPPLGKTALIPKGFPEANVNQAIAIYRIDDPLIREYFAEYLRTDLAQKWLVKRTKKTSGQQNLTLHVVQQLPVPIPPKEVLGTYVMTAREFASARCAIEGVLKDAVALGTALMNEL